MQEHCWFIQDSESSLIDEGIRLYVLDPIQSLWGIRLVVEAEQFRSFLKWSFIVLLGALAYLGLILATAWLLLTVSWFYFFWSYGLSAVASYMLTDFTSREVFDRVRSVFTIRFKILKAASFIEMVFLTAILASLLDYAFQTSLKDHIDLVLEIAYPGLIILAGVYYIKVYGPRGV
jgi:hypothetical protein